MASRSGRKPLASVMGTKATSPPASAWRWGTRVVRRADEVQVAGVGERQGKWGDALLGADEADHLVGLVQVRHAEALGVPTRHGLAEGRQALVVRVAVVGGVLGGFVEGVHDESGGRQIGVADAQADDVHAARGDLLLHAVDLGEQVGRQFGNALGQLEIGHVGPLLGGY